MEPRLLHWGVAASHKRDTAVSAAENSCGAIPEVSIIIVHWNTPGLLTRCLAGVAAAVAGLTYETIVVDNGSKPSARMSVQSARGLVALYNSTNRGFAVAANQGAAIARADLLLFLNTDVSLTPGSVAGLVSCLRRRPHLAALAATAVAEGGRERHAGLNFLNPINHAGEMLGLGGPRPLRRSRGAKECTGSGIHEADWLRASTVLVRTPAFRSVCGFDEGYFFYEEDEDLCWRLRRRGYDVAESRDLRVQDPGSLSAAQVRDWATLCLYRGQQRFMRRRGGATALLTYRVCVTVAIMAKAMRGSFGRAGHLCYRHGRATAIVRSLWQPTFKSKEPITPA